MNNFEEFVESLGPEAEKYTPAQLCQLHAEVYQVAQMLIDVYREEHRVAPPTALTVPLPTRARPSEAFPLRGRLLCPKCGKPMTGSVSRGRSRQYAYYHC